MEPKTHRYVQYAIEAGNLNEVIRLCWRDIKAAKGFCSAQVLCLARLMTYFDDQEGLTLLREVVRDRIGRDKHYQPPFMDARDDLLWRLDCGIEEGRFLQKVARYLSQTPSITRRMLYEEFSVFRDKKAKLAADKLKPPELRTDDYIPEREFASKICLVPSIEHASNEEFCLVRSDEVGPDDVVCLREFERPNLRPSPPPSPGVGVKRQSDSASKGKTDNLSLAAPKQGCALTLLFLAVAGLALLLLWPSW